MHTPYSLVTSIVDTPSKVYYMSKGSLFSYDKENQESYVYSTSNKLTDTGVSGIYYNAPEKYLLVTYTNGNMDFLYDDGKVVNMSDIKDAVLTTLKTIYGVSFVDGKTYIATEFGIVLVDDATHTVKESGIFNKQINAFTKVGDHYLIAYDQGLFVAPANSRINNINNFKKIDSVILNEIVPLSDNKALIRPEKNISLVNFDFDQNKMNVEKSFGGDYPYKIHGNYYADGFYFTNNMTIAMYNFDDSSTTLKYLPSSKLYLKPLAFWSSVDNLWTSCSEGIANVKWESNGEFVYLTDYFTPSSFTVRPVSMLVKDNFNRIFATTVSTTRKNGMVVQPNAEEPYRKATNICMIDEDGSLKDVTPDNMLNPYSTNRLTAYEPFPGSGKMSMGTGMSVHPKNPDIIFASNFYDGLYKISIKDGCLYLYGKDNSKVSWDGWESYVGYTDFDSKGNLWVAQYKGNNPQNINLLMLPADKVDNAETTSEDWIGIETPLEIGLDPMLKACKNSNVVCLYSSNFGGGIVFHDWRGTNATSDDRQKHYDSFIDQDGKLFTPIFITCIVEVENGKLWVGTDDGVFEIANPESMLGEGRITRLKVPRNDGTGLADYLMGSQLIHDIAMDASKNKWIATQEGGLFKVSPDGRTILQHFTSDNSPLISNKVLSVACSPVNNIVYVGTDDGLYEYQSDSAPAEDDYSNVLAYPNPVRPDYSGWITIKGLMENSLVKIADAAGNIVSQGTSAGGMYTWDGCNFNGERVKTGVYYVYASQSGDMGSNAVVTKIMVVR